MFHGIQEVSLCTIMKLMESEGNTPAITKTSSKEVSFPVEKFQVFQFTSITPRKSWHLTAINCFRICR